MEVIEEVWVSLDLLPNYAVSNYGRVMNVHTGRDLQPTRDGGGYLKVALYHRGVRRDVYVHRLVAKAFFLNYAPNVAVSHINGDKEENTVLNLTLKGPCRSGHEL